jgi:hypothetical protein
VAGLEIFGKVILMLNEQIQQLQQKILAERQGRTEPPPKYAGNSRPST